MSGSISDVSSLVRLPRFPVSMFYVEILFLRSLRALIVWESESCRDSLIHG